MMVQGSILALLDSTETFIIECDASKSTVGAMLTQEGKPIAFFSQALKRNNSALSTYDKEMLVLLMTIQKWCHYFHGRTFAGLTDYNSNIYVAKELQP